MQGLKQKRIGVLMGGLSRERDVSLRSGAAVSKALQSKGYQVVDVDVGTDIAAVLVKEKIEVAFLALHGRYGEDGSMQGLLEMMKIPYTGSGLLPSAICMDKELTKRLVEKRVKTPSWKVLHRGDKSGECPFPTPVIVKPNSEGSTIGTNIVREPSAFAAAVEEAFRHDSAILVEEFVQGTEVTVAVLKGKALPVLEIVPKSGFYDFTSKYTKGMTDYIVPARISEVMARNVSQVSESIFVSLALSGYARMDFIFRGEDPYFLEVNTIPGMTETSLVPKAAMAAGVTFEDLCESILSDASLKI